MFQSTAIVNQKLTLAGIPIQTINVSPDPEIEDDEIVLSGDYENITVQCGEGYACVVALTDGKNGKDNYLFYPQRTHILTIISDCNKAREERS